MKKLLSVVFLFLCIFFLTACGTKETDLSKTVSEKFGVLNYEVPEAFEKRKMDSIENATLTFFDYNYYYDVVASNGKYDEMCSLGFFHGDLIDGYDLEKTADIFNEGKKGTKKTINGTEWIVIKEDQDGDGKFVDYYYYGLANNKTYYEVHYSDWGNGTQCEEAHQIIINSLKFDK